MALGDVLQLDPARLAVFGQFHRTGDEPLASAFADRVLRRTMLVALDLTRATVAVALPFVTEVWQVYILIFLLQAASAGFTPTFQATIPDVLPDEADYTRALSLSRLACDLENLLSPMLAAALLTVVSFLASAALVLTVTLPSPRPAAPRGVRDRTTRGIRNYLATPRLRGLLALNLCVAAAGAMVIVNTVVIVQAGLGLGETQVALALAAFGAGSMMATLVLPRLLDRMSDRPPMIAGAAILAAGMLLGPLVGSLPTLGALWLILGFGYSLMQTPTGRLLRRSAQPEDLPAIFAAQFALSHVCWLLTYPLAGWAGATFGLDATFLILAAIAALGLVAALRLWPANFEDDIPHHHADLPASHPHMAAHGNAAHYHPVVIDDLHRTWPYRRDRPVDSSFETVRVQRTTVPQYNVDTWFEPASERGPV